MQYLLDGEQGNTEMEGLLHSTESDDLKIPSLPISTAAIMPSPILLWRFKVFVLLIGPSVFFLLY
jgi:hypothetical protein